MAESLDFYQTLTDNVFDGLIKVDVNGKIHLWNKGAERITGHPAEKMIGRIFQESPANHLQESGQEIRESNNPLLQTLRDGVQRETMVYFKHNEGYRTTALARIMPVKDKHGKINGAVEIINDNKAIIAVHQQTKRTEETVLFDALTGIGNRPHIESKIRYALEDCRASNESVGVLFMDIDHFKNFNDDYGHLIGDKILRFTANTLRQHLRVTDSCGRWGGEEFLALINDAHPEKLNAIAEKLRQLVEQSYLEDDGRKLHVTISIGATIARKDDTLQSVLQRADELLYKSKANGRNRVTMDN